MEGIIIGNISNTYKIETIETKYIDHARGKFKNQDIKPLVGDRVEIEVIDEEKNEAIIEEIKTRKNEIKRPIDDIKGLGKVKKQALLKQFETFDAIKKASVEELNMVKGIDKNLAITIYNYLQKF